MQVDEPAGPNIGRLLLSALGILLIFIGLGIGLWVLGIAYNALYKPESIPLLTKVVQQIEKNDVVFREVKGENETRWEGAGVRYLFILLVIVLVFASFGGVIRGFISAGASLLNASLGKPSPDVLSADRQARDKSAGHSKT